MGCVCGKASHPTSSLEVTFNHTVALLPSGLDEATLKRLVHSRFPQLRFKAWCLVDARTGAQLRTPSQHQGYMSALKGREAGKLTVHLDNPVEVSANSPLHRVLSAICAVWEPTALLCNGLHIGNGLVLVPEAAVRPGPVLQAVFRLGSEELIYPIQSSEQHYSLKDCQIALVHLGVSPVPAFLSKQTPVSFLHPGPKAGAQLTCYCHSIPTPVLRAVSGLSGASRDDHFTLSTTLPKGSGGSPVFSEDGMLAGLVLEGSSCVPTWKLVAGLKLHQGNSEIEELLTGGHMGERSRESFDLNGISLEEDRSLPGITILESPVNALHKAKQQTAQPLSEFQFDDDLDKAPLSPTSPSHRKESQEPRAFSICTVENGSELWRISRSDYAIMKETGASDVPKGCSLVDTPQGVMVMGGEDTAGRKVCLWTSKGLKSLGTMRYFHSKHSSILVGRHIYVISGQSTDTVESVDFLTFEVAAVEPLPKQRYCAGVCAMQQTALFLAGGYVGPQGRPSRSVLELKLHKGEWSKLGLKLDSPVSSPALVFLPPMALLLMGGRTAQGRTTSEAFILDIQSCLRTAALFLPEPALFSHCTPVKDDSSLITFTDSRHCFEYDIRRQRFYLISI